MVNSKMESAGRLLFFPFLRACIVVILFLIHHHIQGEKEGRNFVILKSRSLAQEWPLTELSATFITSSRRDMNEEGRVWTLSSPDVVGWDYRANLLDRGVNILGVT